MKAQQAAYRLVEPGTVVWDRLDGHGPIVQLEAYSDPSGLDLEDEELAMRAVRRAIEREPEARTHPTSPITTADDEEPLR